MTLKNSIRSLFHIRAPRELPPPGPKPPVGSNIVRDTLRIRLKYPVDHEQWDWFAQRGWRTTDMRQDRRQYTLVADPVLVKLLQSSGPERDEIHQRMLSVYIKSAERAR
jgi:hypothetical protein